MNSEPSRSASDWPARRPSARAAAQRTDAATYGRHAIVQPTDWTDEDEALANGQPISWLR
jgi:hypothetical protein